MSPQKNKLSQDECLAMYREMLLIRRFEERSGQLYGMGLIGGFCHLYIGQEAVVSGINSVIKEGDTMITSYRDHAHMLALGMTADGVMAELTGRKDGYSKGKGGSMHMFSKEKNFYGGHGIVGAQIPIGVGLAFSHKYQENGAVSLAFLGDGAMNQGQVYESFNMASLWKLPVIFVIENNRYGMGTSITRSAAGGNDLYKRGEPFGIKGAKADGMDVFAVRDAAKEAVDYVRAGNGPYVLQLETYRYRGHSVSDPAKYRTKEEVDSMKRRDPIIELKGYLIEQGVTEDALKAIDKDVRKIVVDAAQFATDNPEPDEAELYTDILVEAN
ncbi:MAG: pyruvate dehydrogenase (acetyl-transferring) E1 component subunit alpha [Alphaproteobacteria bacterium]